MNGLKAMKQLTDAQLERMNLIIQDLKDTSLSSSKLNAGDLAQDDAMMASLFLTVISNFFIHVLINLDQLPSLTINKDEVINKFYKLAKARLIDEKND
jgi:hypothetical protein